MFCSEIVSVADEVSKAAAAIATIPARLMGVTDFEYHERIDSIPLPSDYKARTFNEEESFSGILVLEPMPSSRYPGCTAGA